MPVLGVAQRGGDVVAKVSDSVGGKAVLRFLLDNVEPHGSLLITDEWRSYRTVEPLMPHAVIKHSEAYADGETHTNTIEGFWALLKRAWYGSHHHYSRHWMPLFVAEASWKYNHRHNKDASGRSCKVASREQALLWRLPYGHGGYETR